MTLSEFQAKLQEFVDNNITALEGKIKLTSNERAELFMLWKDLNAGDREQAIILLKEQGVDTSQLK